MITLMNVVLPEPFGPIRPRISPWSIARLTSSTARSPPKYLHTPSATSWRLAILRSLLLLAALDSRARSTWSPERDVYDWGSASCASGT